MLLAMDGSDNAERAARVAADLATKYGAELHVLHAFSLEIGLLPVPDSPSHVLAGRIDPEICDRWAAASKEVVARHIQLLLGADVTYTFRQENGDPAETIVRIAAEEGFDLIVVGSRGLGAALRFVLGSVSDRVSHQAPCSVLIVR